MSEINLFQPILIFVSQGEWHAFPLEGKIYSARDRMLIDSIKASGGINELVPPGAYHFNIVMFGGKEILTLVPAPR